MSFKLYGELFADDGKIYDGKTCQATLLADCNPHGELFESVAKTNAEEIVKRCNMHDELVAALKQADKDWLTENVRICEKLGLHTAKHQHSPYHYLIFKAENS